MNFLFLHYPAKGRENEAGDHTLVTLQHHGYNTNEGSEFLDDAIRTEDLPAVQEEENIAGEGHKP